MRFTSPDQERSEGVSIELTPLVDIIFLLLIFFLLTTTFADSGLMKVELPEATSTTRGSSSRVFKIIITEDGVITVDGDEVSIDEMKELIEKRKIKERGIPVLLFADRGARHGKVIEVLDILKYELHLKDVSIATKYKGR